jgi:glycosyltransferase involved in cell wall biosynthesis
MRVLLVANTAASMVWFREPLMRTLVAAGHRVFVAAPDGWGVERILACGASFLPLFQAHGWSFGASERLAANYHDPTQDLEAIRDLRRVCRTVRPDVVLAYTHKMSLLTPVAARLAGVSRVHGMITGLGFPNLTGGPRETVMRAAFHASLAAAGALSTSLIVLNPDNEAELLERRVVPRSKLWCMDGEGVDVDKYAAPPPRWERGAATFLMVARLVGYKGVREYVQAAREVRATHPGARFLLAGGIDTAHPSAVQQRELDEWRNEGVITLVGHVSDIRSVLHEAHVFVLPSLETEGLPMSSMEAMAASRPILTTAVPGNRETVVEGVNGRLVPARDARALASAMRELLDHPELGPTWGAASQALCAERFAADKVNAALLHHLGLR